jgi:hypothetical protein
MAVRDISERSSKMGRDAAILYRNRNPKGADPASYGGLLKLADGSTYWAYIWPRTVNNKEVVELRLVPRKEKNERTS